MRKGLRFAKWLSLILLCMLVCLVTGYIAGSSTQRMQYQRIVQHIHAWDARAMVRSLEALRDGKIGVGIDYLEQQIKAKVATAKQGGLPRSSAEAHGDMLLEDAVESLQAVKLYFDKTNNAEAADGLLADVSLPEQEMIVRRFDAKYRGTGRPVPELAVSEWLGEELTLAELRGDVVVLEFWGTWCRPCVERMPYTQRLHETYKDRGLVVIAIHSCAEGRKASAFVQEHRYTFPVAIDSGKTARQYAVFAYPSYFLIDEKGCLAWGPANDIDSVRDHQLILEEHVQQFLARSRPSGGDQDEQ